MAGKLNLGSVIGGVLKSFDSLENIQIFMAGMYVNLPTINSFIYNLLVNFIGGGAMVYHSIMTLNFKKNLLPNDSIEITETNPDFEKVRLSAFTIITGILTILVSFWNSLIALYVFSSFMKDIITLLPLFLVTLLVYGSYALIPIILAGKTLDCIIRLKELEKSRHL